MKKFILSCCCLGLAIAPAFAQKTVDPVLFSFGNSKVPKSEFLRMYTKNITSQKPDYSEKALREYLTLYSRFKMKVAEAEKVQLDTMPNIQTELGSYKKQLAKTYMTDGEITDKLVKEAYERMKKDVRVSHILLSFPKMDEDTTVIYRRIDSLHQMLQKGMDFSALAAAASDDKPSASKGGDIGYFTAMQIPSYPFESAAYQTPVGSFSKPFRTAFGYHIVKKTGERPARGEIQVAQIMLNVRKSEGEAGEMRAKTRIDSILNALRAGANFETMVERFSDDKFSQNTKGVLATFGVGQMDPAFEDAAFALKNSGDLSNPVKTEYGYHIIKLISKTPLRPFDTLKTDLKKRVEKDGRIEVAKEQYTYKLKQKLGYKENPAALTELINAIPDSTLRNGTYQGNDYGRFTKKLFEMTGASYTQADFANYIQDFTKGKIYGAKEITLRSLYKNYAEKALYDYQENKLVDENPEFKNLVTEYRDGIMLFELTDRNVWNKALVDTVGLNSFYEERKTRYQWPASIKATAYKCADEDYAKKVKAAIADPNNAKAMPDEIVKIASGDGVQNKVYYETGKFEQTRFKGAMPYKAGQTSPYYRNDDGSYMVVDVKDVFNEPTQKTLSEARGFVISEYQEYLEKQWIADMEARYPVKVNEATLKSMVK